MRPAASTPPNAQNRRALTTLTLGLAQAIAANSWGNRIGVLFGGVAFATGAALHLARSSTSPSSASPPKWAPIFWRAAQALSAFVLLLLAVRLASSPDRSVAAFPDACPKGLQGTHGCSRVALQNTHRPPSTPPFDRPFRQRALLADVEAALLRWISQQPRTAVLRHVQPTSAANGPPSGFLHARVVTPVMGFADDFFVRYGCTRAGEAVVEVQGQLRLGVGDMGVNVARNAALLSHLSGDKKRGGGARIPMAAWCR